MSKSMGRRKSSLKGISAAVKEPPGPILKFKWSISAAHLAALEDNASTILPDIVPDRSRRRIFTTASSSLSTDQNSFGPSSISLHKSAALPNTTRQCKSPTSTEADRSSIRSSPLLLTYTQLHQPRSPSRMNRRKISRLSIFQSPEDKRDSFSLDSRKQSIVSRQSITTTTTISLLTNKPDYRMTNETLIRLNSPQLRRLNVSEKYIHEAKTLYFNADCKIFTPRLTLTQVF